MIPEKPKYSITFDSFVTNIYDPTLPDADEKLVSPNADPAKRPALLKYMRELISQYDVGPPMETNGASMKRILAANLVGLYTTDRTSPQSISLLPSFTVPPASDDDEEIEIKRNFHRKRRTNVYKPPAGYTTTPKPKDQSSIDDYSPARHENLVKRSTK